MKFRKVVAVVLCLFIVLSCNSVYADAFDNNPAQNIYVPVLMYHHFQKEVQSNGKSGATITADKFREDMTYLAENDFTPLLPQDLKSIKEGKMDLPEKPVIITLDDGYESAYKIAYPILEETGMKATVFVIVGSVENPRKREIKKLEWEQMKEMYDSGVMDIQSHSYNLHNQELKGKYVRNELNGIQKGLIECKAQYNYRVGGDIEKSIELIEENVGNDVLCFSYPYGVYEEWGEDILEKKGVMFAFGTRYGVGDLKDNLYYIIRFSVGMSTDLGDLLEK